MAANYLQHRGNTWRFYRRVPSDLVPYLGRFWRVNLRTPDRSLAAIQAREHVVETDRLIADTRKRLKPLTVADRGIIDDAGGLPALRSLTVGKPQPRLVEDHGLRGEVALASAAVAILGDVASLSRAEAAQEGINLTEARDDTTDARKVLEAAEGRYQRNLSILAKDTRIRLPAPPKVSPLDPFATSPARAYAARRFFELFPDISLPEITRQHGVAFVNKMSRLPSTTSPRIRPLPILEAIAIADREKLPRVDRATVRQNFFRLSAMLNDAANDGLIKSNPLQGYRFKRANSEDHSHTKVNGEKHAHAKTNGTKHAHAKASRRQGFTPAELRILDAAGDKMREDDRWVFLLGVYQGARREECAQLRKADIHQKNGVWCMQITDEAEGQRVKNVQSVRLIPLHANLIARGFLDYVQGVDDDRLFPKLIARKTDWRVSSNLGIRFAHRCRRLGIKKSFHSARHSWKTAARNAGLPEEVAEAISGRRAGSGVGSIYGDLADPAALAPWLNKVKPFDDPGPNRD